MTRPVVLVGCGRLGSAIVEGWMTTGGLHMSELVILTPSSKPVAEAAAVRGARINPDHAAIADAGSVVLAVKPGRWREAAGPLADMLATDAAIVSVMAGVRAEALSSVFGARPVARVMPTTAVASGQGVAALWSGSDQAGAEARRLFTPLADVVELEAESDIDIATAVAGSGPAYVHAFTLALAEAAEAEGLCEQAAVRLARGAVRSAASGQATASLQSLIARIASPGGTTEAGLAALNEAGVSHVAAAAVSAALARARALAAD